MAIYLDDEPVTTSATTVGQVVKDVQIQAQDRGRMVIEVQLAGQVLTAQELAQREAEPVGAGEMRLYSAEPRELGITALAQAGKKLEEAREAQARASELFQQDKAPDALAQVGQAVQAWLEVEAAIEQVCTLLKLDLDRQQVDGRPVNQMLSDLVTQLRELKDLVQARDTVALADSLGYEWPQTVDRWQALLQMLIATIEEQP